MAPPSTPPRKPAPPTTAPAPKPKPIRVLPGAIPGAAPAVGDLFTASGRNPFRVTGPAVVSFSGGRTSGMMLRKVLDAYGGTLPDDIHVVFANTGAEDTRTLDFVAECAERWSVNIRWLEYDPDAPGRFREVTYETASRDYEPFDAVIRTRKALPDGRKRFCTIDLKIKVMRNFMRSQGYRDDEWTNTVGLRADEAHRLANLRDREETTWDVVAPLLDAGVRKADVLAWWRRQPFDLTTPETRGNCVACFLKGRGIRDSVARDDPDALVWWAEKERETGRRFIFKEPEGYAGTIRRAHLRVIAGNEARGAPTHAPGTGEPLDPEYGPEDFASIPCDCTERRAPPLPCVCPGPRPTRGDGHTLVCAALRAEARTPGPAGWAAREAHERHHTGGRRRDRAWRLSGRGEWRQWMGDLDAEDRAMWERAAEEADITAGALPPPPGPA